MTKRNKLPSDKLLWPDGIRAISIFLVVLLHVSAKIVTSWNLVSTSDWMIGNIFDSFSRISVPLFVILSGSLILHKKENLNNFIKKRFKRIIIPWIFWGTILLFFNNYFKFAEFGEKNIKILLIENYFGGFWFIPMLIGIYLLTPIIKPFVQKAKNIDFLYFFSIWFISASLIPTLNNIFGITIGINLPIWIQYLGYYVGGYYIVHKINLNKQKNRHKKLIIKYSKILFIINFLIIVGSTYILTIKNNYFIDYIYDYLSIPVIITSFSGFILIKNYFENLEIYLDKNKAKNKIKIIRFFSKQSFEIFLSHMLVIRILEIGALGFQLSALSFNPIFSIPMITIFTIIISGIVTALLQKTLSYLV